MVRLLKSLARFLTSPVASWKRYAQIVAANVINSFQMKDENTVLRSTLDRERSKVDQMVKLLNEDNEQLKTQLKEDSALIESSNHIIKKLRQALEEYPNNWVICFIFFDIPTHSTTSFNSDSAYKNSLLSELEHDVVARLTPRIAEIEDEITRITPLVSSPASPAPHALRVQRVSSHTNGSPYQNAIHHILLPTASCYLLFLT